MRGSIPCCNGTEHTHTTNSILIVHATNSTVELLQPTIVVSEALGLITYYIQ